MEEPPAEPLERKPKDVVVRSKSRGNKSGERPQKKPTQLNVSSTKRARLNIVMNSTKSNAMRDDPLLQSKEFKKVSK